MCYYHSCCVINDYGYVIGGSIGNGKNGVTTNTRNYFRYDFYSDEWTKVSSNRIARWKAICVTDQSNLETQDFNEYLTVKSSDKKLLTNTPYVFLSFFQKLKIFPKNTT